MRVMVSGAWRSVEDVLDLLNHAPGTHDQKSHGGKGGAGGGDARIGELRSELDAIAAQAEPLAAANARYRELSRAPTAQENREFGERLQRLRELNAEAAPKAQELLDRIEERDGPLRGGGAESGKWREATSADLRDRGTLDPGTRKEIRDRYVAQDRQTLTNNASLRSGDPAPGARRWAGQMDKLVGSSELSADVKVYRGAALSPETIGGFRPGKIVSDNGFVSTDVSRDTAEFYGGDRASSKPGTITTTFEIHVSAGTSAADVGYGEVVLGRGQSFRVLSSERQSDGSVQVSMEVAP